MNVCAGREGDMGGRSSSCAAGEEDTVAIASAETDYRTFSLSSSSNTGRTMQLPRHTSSTVALVIQLIFVVLFAVSLEYDDLGKTKEEQAANFKSYPTFMDVHVMIFMGIGFLLSFMRKYSYSASSYNLFIGCLVVQWALLVNGWMKDAFEGHAPRKIAISVADLLSADFAAGATLISWCCVIGKTSRLQLIVLALLEPVFFALNQNLCLNKLNITDCGGSITLHAFAAYFGLGMAWAMQTNDILKPTTHAKLQASYTSDLFAICGTAFLFCFWPSFNGCLLSGLPVQQNRAFVNTFIALAASTVTVFVTSPLLNDGKIRMDHVQNAILSGGVSVGACANLPIGPWAACLLGTIMGIVSTIGFQYLTSILHEKLRIHDACGAHNLHGIPGVLSGLAAAIATATIADSRYEDGGLVSIYEARGQGRSQRAQVGYQVAAIGVTIAIAMVSGILTGFIARWFDQPSTEQFYDDKSTWEVEETIHGFFEGDVRRTGDYNEPNTKGVRGTSVLANANVRTSVVERPSMIDIVGKKISGAFDHRHGASILTEEGGQNVDL